MGTATSNVRADNWLVVKWTGTVEEGWTADGWVMPENATIMHKAEAEAVADQHPGASAWHEDSYFADSFPDDDDDDDD